MINQIILGNCLEVLKIIPSGSIDLVFTDPPYNISSDLKVTMSNHPDTSNKQERTITYDFGEWDKFDSEKSHMDFTEQWMKECYRVLTPQGNFVTFFANWLTGDIKRIWEGFGGRARQKIYWMKCLSGDTIVYVRNKSNTNIELINLSCLYSKDCLNYEILTPNGFKNILGMKYMGNDECLNVTTPIGGFTASPNHLFPSYKKTLKTTFQKIGDRELQDILKSPKYYSFFVYDKGWEGKTKKFDFSIFENDIFVIYDWKNLGVEYKLLCDNVKFVYDDEKHRCNKLYWHINRGEISLSILKNHIDIYKENLKIRSTNTKTFCSLPMNIDLCYEIGWIVGLFIAEGSYDKKTQIRFSLSNKEIDKYERIKKYLSIFGIPSYLFENNSNNGISVYFGNRLFRKLFEFLVNGHGAKGKRLNLPYILNTNKEFRKGIYDGVFDGDGSKRVWNGKNDKISEYHMITLCNKELVNDIKTLGISIGKLNYSVIEYQAPYTYKNKTFNATAYRMNSKTFKQNSYELNHKMVGILSSNVTKSDLYDIAVDGNYFVINNGFITHNSNPKPRLRKVDLMQGVEEMFWGTKADQGHIFNYELGQQLNYVMSAVFYNNETTGHPTQKPERVVEWIIDYLSNKDSIVLDPFSGSGTIPYCAYKHGRNYIGIEMDKDYVEISNCRINKLKSHKIKTIQNTYEI